MRTELPALLLAGIDAASRQADLKYRAYVSESKREPTVRFRADLNRKELLRNVFSPMQTRALTNVQATEHPQGNLSRHVPLLTMREVGGARWSSHAYMYI